MMHPFSHVDLMSFLREPLASKLGLVCFHTIWQGIMVATLLSIVLRTIPRNSIAKLNARYLFATLALISLPAISIVTFLMIEAELRPFSVTRQQVIDATIAGAGNPSTRLSLLLEWSTSRIEPWLPSVSLLWGAGATLAALRMAVGWAMTRRLVDRAMSFSEDHLQLRVQYLGQMLGIRSIVRLLVSDTIDSPVVVGWVRPVILWPVSAVVGLSPNAIDAIIAHELAHIRRQDFLVNCIQACIEVLFFHHPAAWWISAQIRVEREHCADELAVKALENADLGSRLSYAQSLLSLEEHRRVPPLSIAAKGGNLLDRIRRLVGANDIRSSFAKLLAAIMATICLLGLLVASNFVPNVLAGSNLSEFGETQIVADQSQIDTNIVSLPIAEAIVVRLSKTEIPPDVINSLRKEIWLAINAGKPLTLQQVHERLGQFGFDWRILHYPPTNESPEQTQTESTTGDATIVDAEIASSIVARLAAARVDSEILSATRDFMWEAIREGRPERLSDVHELLIKLGIPPDTLHAPRENPDPQGKASATIQIRDAINRK